MHEQNNTVDYDYALQCVQSAAEKKPLEGFQIYQKRLEILTRNSTH